MIIESACTSFDFLDERLRCSAKDPNAYHNAGMSVDSPSFGRPIALCLYVRFAFHVRLILRIYKVELPILCVPPFVQKGEQSQWSAIEAPSKHHRSTIEAVSKHPRSAIEAVSKHPRSAGEAPAKRGSSHKP